MCIRDRIRIAANGEVSKLADVIDVYYIKDGKQITSRTGLTDENKIGTLSQVCLLYTSPEAVRLKEYPLLVESQEWPVKESRSMV